MITLLWTIYERKIPSRHIWSATVLLLALSLSLLCSFFSATGEDEKWSVKPHKQVLHLELLKWIFQSDLLQIKMNQDMIMNHKFFMGQNRKWCKLIPLIAGPELSPAFARFLLLPLPQPHAQVYSIDQMEIFFQNSYSKMYFRNIRNLALSASTDGKSITCLGKEH